MTCARRFASLSLLVGVLLHGCGGEGEAGPEELLGTAAPLISDQAHSGGRQGFFFLPPLVPNPRPTGVFEPRLRPVVRIDRIDPMTGQVLETVVTYDTEQRVHGSKVRRNERRGHYVVRWRTREFDLAPSRTYRIRVIVEGHELGFADVDVVGTTRELRNVDRDLYVPLKVDSTLAIKFRIETQAVDRDGDGVWDWVDNCPDTPNGPGQPTWPGPGSPTPSGCDPDADECDPDEHDCGAGEGPAQVDTDEDGIGDACECLGVTCAPAEGCHGAGVCDASTGACDYPALPDGDGDGTCDALDGCPSDPGKIAPGSCGCGHADADGDGDGQADCADPCPDDPYDLCGPGGCSSDPTICSDGDACNGTETCNPWGACVGGVAPTIDDGNPCTIDACDATSGVSHTPVTAGTSCSDDDACNGAETCNASGTCTQGTAPTIDDGNPCTIDACDPTSGVSHTPVTAGTSCSDDDACNGAETCNASGTCTPGTAPTIDDGNPCTIDACDATSGVSHTPVTAGTSCSDGDACNGAETCNASGTCTPGTAPTIDDGNPCTIDACDAASGVSHTPVTTGTSCGDGNACNGAETCNPSGACVGGVAPTIDDGNPCTIDACDAASGVSHTPVTAGTSCSDNDACNGAETCNASGTCTPGTAPTINDGNPCTIDACDPASGVSHTPVTAGTSCGDGNACNGAETCNASGTCTQGTAPTIDDGNPCTTDACDATNGVSHTPVATGTSCGDGNACNGAETCNATGACTPGAAPSIDDGNPCTIDACDPANGVSHTPVTAGTSCSDDDACNGAETCNPSGACVGGVAPTIDDGNPCTIDACDATSGVSHTPVATGTSCGDGNACNGAETCNASGTCTQGTAPTIDDGNPCTIDACDPAHGVSHTPVTAGTSCSDDDACNGAETCNASGTCTQGTAPSIDDGNPCTIDACDATSGVSHTPVTAGTSCSDDDACNGAETCNASGTCTQGTAPTIDDGNPCTIDACDPTSGVSHTPVTAGTSCSDNDACNGAETCNASGTCTPGTAPTIDDGNPCTIDACDPANGVSHTPVTAGTSCSDDDACNGAETCNSSAICAAGTAPPLDDGDACTHDSCDPQDGVRHAPIAGCLQAPLPVPDAAFETAPATLVAGGVDLIDPHGALAGLQVVITPLFEAAASVSGADHAWSIEPSGPLAHVVFARFPLTEPMPAGEPMLLFTRPGPGSTYTLQSLGRVTSDGLHVLVALRHFSHQAFARVSRPTSTVSAPTRLHRSDPFDGGDVHAVGLGLARNSPLAFLALYESGDDPLIVHGATTYPGSPTSRVHLAESTGAHVRSTRFGEVATDSSVIASGVDPSISADARHIAYTSWDFGPAQVVVHGLGVISTDATGQPGDGPSQGAILSASGRFVAFASNASNLDPADDAPGFFIRDLAAATPERLALSYGDIEDRLEIAPIPYAVSDGGRFVFFRNVPAYYGEDCDGCGNSCEYCGGSCQCWQVATSLDPHDFDDADALAVRDDPNADGLLCRTFWRFDRATGELVEVAHGNWMAVDRSGRTVAYHPCRWNVGDEGSFLSDFTGPSPYTNPTTFAGMALQPLHLRDVRTGQEVTFGPTIGEIADANPGMSSDPAWFVLDYWRVNVNAGTLSGDGTVLAYAINAQGFETPWTYETWLRPVPDLTPVPTLAVGPVLEHDPFPVSFGNMLGETTGDLIMLSDAGGPIAVRGTVGATSGTVTFDGVAPGSYFLDVYYALDGDPASIRFRKRFDLTVGARTPVVALVGPACEYGTLTVATSGFSERPGDFVVLTRDGQVVETRPLDGAASATLVFTSQLAPGPYVLEAWITRPATPSSPATPELRATFPLDAGGCLQQLAADGPAPGLGVASCVIQSITYDSEAYPRNYPLTWHHSTPLAGVTSDGRHVIYRTADGVFVHDRVTGTTRTQAMSSDGFPVHGLAVSADGTKLAVAWGWYYYVYDTATGQELGFVNPASTYLYPDRDVTDDFGESAMAISNDGHRLLHSMTVWEGNDRLTNLLIWDLSGSGATFVRALWGCAPSLSGDGRWLVETVYGDPRPVQSIYDPSTRLAPKLLDLAGLTPLSQLSYVELDLGQAQDGDYVFAARATLSPDGNRLVFASNTPPDPSFIADPPYPVPAGRTWLYSQLRDGSERRVVASFDNQSPHEDVIGWGATLVEEEFVESTWQIFAGHRMFDVFPVGDDGTVLLDGRFWFGEGYDIETAGVFAWTPQDGVEQIVAGIPDGLVRHHHGVAKAQGARRFVFWSDAAGLPADGSPFRLYVASHGP